MSSPRAGLRFLNTFRQSLRFQAQRRYATVDSTVKADAAPAATGFWNSPVGPKTVHFWAPVMKWGIVLAGAADFARPASQLSLSQNAALLCTGLIWTRWCFVIKPRNLFLASVNFLLFCVGASQVTRALLYQQSLKADGLLDEAEKAAKQEGKIAEGIAKNPEAAAKKATNV